MKMFNGFHACTVLGGILLSSLGVICVSIGIRDLGDSTQILLNVTSLPLETPLSTGSIDEHAALTAPLEASFNNTFATDGAQQPRPTTPIDHEVVRGSQGVDTPSTTSMQQDLYLPSVKPKESDENALRTSTITIASSLRPDIEVNVPSATVDKATLLIPTTNEPVVSKSLEGPLVTKAADNVFEHASLSQFNTEEMLTTNPRTNIVPTGIENSTSPVLFDGHSENTEQVARLPSIASLAPLTTAISVSAEQSIDVSVYLSPENKHIKETEETQTSSATPVSEVSEEWDDTKLIAKNHLKFSMHENLTASTDPDPRSTGVFFENPTDTTTEKIEEKDYTGTEERPLMTVAKGDILVNSTDPSPNDSEAAFVDGAKVTLPSTNIRDEIAISTPLPDAIGHTKMKTNIYKAKVVSVVSESPHLDDTKTQAKEAASKSMPTRASYASSERTLLAPSAKLDSEEEGEEEREGEEEDDEDTEDDDDEDEDEEDKDVDSVDDSVEGDTELPAFTLPGLSSEEPLLENKNQPALEEVPYRVPDTLEWEQQNQGLVRSWMEKLKDKAGYMSGMLLPVGIGIAGAFSILGALYSIKFMNRRRRLGFKRHKRKQREFNSMQDRVMLLADSSEDEF